MRFLQRIEGVTLFDKIRNCENRKSLNIEPYFTESKGLSLDGLANGHVSRMPQERLPKQA